MPVGDYVVRIFDVNVILVIQNRNGICSVSENFICIDCSRFPVVYKNISDVFRIISDVF